MAQSHAVLESRVEEITRRLKAQAKVWSDNLDAFICTLPEIAAESGATLVLYRPRSKVKILVNGERGFYLRQKTEKQMYERPVSPHHNQLVLFLVREFQASLGRSKRSDKIRFEITFG